MAKPHVYPIRVEGHLPERWSDWFADMKLTRTEPGHTLLCGPVVDQAALHGVLAKIRDLNMKLIAVERVETDQPGKARE